MGNIGTKSNVIVPKKSPYIFLGSEEPRKDLELAKQKLRRMKEQLIREIEQYDKLQLRQEQYED